MREKPICDECLKELHSQINNPPKDASWFLIHITHDKCTLAAESFLRFIGAIKEEKHVD